MDEIIHTADKPTEITLQNDAKLLALHIIEAAYHERDLKKDHKRNNGRTEYVYGIIQENNVHAHKLIAASQGRDSDTQFHNEVVDTLKLILHDNKDARKAWKEFKPAILAKLKESGLSGLAEALSAKTLETKPRLLNAFTNFSDMFARGAETLQKNPPHPMGRFQQ